MKPDQFPKPNLNQENNSEKKEGISQQQIENIKEVFALNPELENLVHESLGEIDYKDIRIEFGRNKEVETLGKVQNINVFYKGDLIVDSDNSVVNKTNEKLFIVTKQDGTSYVGDVALPEALRGQGFGIKILQKISNRLNTRIIPTYVSTGGHTSPSARSMWEKVNNEIVPNTEAEKLYAKYLESNFSNHEKEILWHGSSSEKIEGEIRMNERDSGWFGNGFYLSSEQSYGKRWGTNIHPMLISAGKYAEIEINNNRNPKYVGDAEIANTEAGGTEGWLLNEQEYSKKFTEALKRMGNIGARIKMDGFKDAEVVIFDPSLIHILGSEKDIEQFKNWVEKQHEEK